MSEQRRIWMLVAVVAAAASTGWIWRAEQHQPRTATNASPAPIRAGTASRPEAVAWPHPKATLSPPDATAPKGWKRRRIFIDPGHGAKGNPGNSSSFCVDEQDFTLRVAERLEHQLTTDGSFEVRLSRRGKELVGYRQRVAQANDWQAHAFISIHSDVRGDGQTWHPTPDQSCLRSRVRPGFSVLWSDESASLKAARRLGLARAVGRRLKTLGLPAYNGDTYAEKYAGDDHVPGVFVDRHVPGERIFVLRAPQMPSILIETHHALDDREAQRWEQPETVNAFAASLKRALFDFFNG